MRPIGLEAINRLYAAIFASVAIYSLGVLAVSLVPMGHFRSPSLRYPEWVLGFAEAEATLCMFGCALIGVALCLGCFWLNREPTDRLANCKLAAIVLTVCLFLFLPAIQA